MIAVLVANTKGGCGKTTISTHLAAAFATTGRRTALADADRQHSSFQWTRLRPGNAAAITPLDWLDRLTDRTIYNDVAAAGLSIFDLSGKRAENSRKDWHDVLDYVGA